MAIAARLVASVAVLSLLGTGVAGPTPAAAGRAAGAQAVTAQAEGRQAARGGHRSAFANFVTRTGDKMMDGTTEYRFLSAATPTLQIVEDNFTFADSPQLEWRWPDAFEIRDTLATIKQMGGQATRIYCLSVRRSTDAAAIPRHIVGPASRPDGSVNPAAFNEEGFRVLDRILATANEVGVRVVIPITNQYPWHGGYTDLAALRGKPAAEFYTDPELVADYKAIVSYLLNRRNTITGVRYADDKAVLSWAYGNELNSATDAWLLEMGRHIKSLDPNHLLMQHETRRNIGARLLTNPYIDVVATSVYDNFSGNTPAIVAQQRAQSAGSKPYVAFEFGFATPETIAATMDTLIANGSSGGQLWGLRPHNRDGGFYWHGEEAFGDDFFLRSYHWPGFPSGARYDEAEVMTLLRNKAYEIRGLTAPPVPAPRAPRLLPIREVKAISWQGSVGAQTYQLERATAVDKRRCRGRGPCLEWTVLDADVTDDVAYTPIYNDATATIGRTYWYRVRARNTSGVSAPSNVVGPVRVRRLALVDDMRDLSKVAAHTANVAVETSNNRRVLERLARVRRTAPVAGESITYAVPGRLTSASVQTFFQNTVEHFTLSGSADGVTFRPLAAATQQYGSDPGVYGYWYRVRYDVRRLPPGVRYLRIEFPNLPDAATPQISRVELDYVTR
ncbi:MAG TPA: hypothetical protein VES42_25685 [Pilimelia sp.]|nr:hypothetical protein [Pilimelia sp.]